MKTVVIVVIFACLRGAGAADYFTFDDSIVQHHEMATKDSKCPCDPSSSENVCCCFTSDPNDCTCGHVCSSGACCKEGWHCTDEIGECKKHSTRITPWMIGLIILGGMFLVSSAVFVYVCLKKRRGWGSRTQPLLVPTPVYNNVDPTAPDVVYTQAPTVPNAATAPVYR